MNKLWLMVSLFSVIMGFDVAVAAGLPQENDSVVALAGDRRSDSACVECGKIFEPGDVAVKHACDHWFHSCCLERADAVIGERYCSHCLCLICLNPLGKAGPLIKKFRSCKHMLHGVCAVRWRNKCPMCRHGEPEDKEKTGWTPLHYAVLGGKTPIVGELLRCADVNIDEVDVYGFTALHIAASRNDVDMIRLLEALGADVNAEALDGCSPLHFAIALNKIDAVRVLVEEYGADIRKATNEGDTVLHFAAEYGGAVWDIVFKHVLVLDDKIVLVDKQNNLGDTALHIAARAGKIGVVEALVHLGANKEIRNCDGALAMHCAEGDDLVAITRLLYL